MLRLSTQAKLIQLTPFPTTYGDAVIRVYSGDPPVTADQAPTGTYLGYITRDGLSPTAGHGLHFIVRPDAIVTRTDGEVWTLIGLATGIAGWGRLAAFNDPPIFQPGAARIDFEVRPDDGIGLYLSNPNIHVGLSADVPFFNYSIPG